MSGSSRNINPLHAIVSPTNQSEFSALAPAIPPPCISQPGVLRLRQPVYIIPSKSAAASPPRGILSTPITFDIKDNAGYGNGFAMRDLCARSGTVLNAFMKGGEDRVLLNVAAGNITFRIMWPGYAPSVLIIDIASEKFMNRVRIAQIISQNFARFIEVHRTATSSQSMFGIAEAGIRLDHLFLLSLQNTYDDSWQADVIVDMRTN